MDLKYELFKKQPFFNRELKERVFWFIHLRWLAVGLALAVSWCAFLLGQDLRILPLNIILFFIVCYNAVFLLIGRRLEFFKSFSVKPYSIFAHMQISLDFLALYSIIYFTGGIYSPLLILIPFHVILAGILFSPVSCFLYGLSLLLVLGVLSILESTRFLALQPILFQNSRYPLSREYPDMLVPFLVFSAAILIAVFIIATAKISLRNRARQFLGVSPELEASSAKLSAFNEMVKEITLKTDLQGLMDSAVRCAAKIMGVKACSIKLLEEDKDSLRFASIYGLSENYLSKDAINIQKSPINRKVIQGSPYVIGHIDEKDFFEYPEDIRKEGITSMLCLPLRVEKKIFGIFCVYSKESYRFGESDIEFFSLMTDLTALAIENLRSELTKSWFMMKAAHQLRSPLNAVYSMLKLVGDGNLGLINQKQRETITRCQKRIEILGNLIKDLLMLGEKRAAAAQSVLYPVNPKKIMMPLVDLYQIQASENGLNIEFHVQDTVPQILANNRLIDELFTNLISNAIKYTPRGGKVEVALCEEGGNKVRFEVSDTGIGIAEDDIPHLFTEFFRTENAKALSEEGTGLGLVIAKEIVDRLGGTIQVKSKIGVGSQFTCLLPLIHTP